MKKYFFVMIVIIAFHVDSKAQTTDKKAAIKELFIVMHQDSLMNKTMREMTLAMAGRFRAGNTTDTATGNFMEKMMEKQMVATKSMVTRMVNEDLVDIYDKYFTVQEIKDFTAFYKSKSGQQLLDKSPDITKELMMIVTTKYLPDMQKAMKEGEKTN